ncbi:MAG: hypothetical protein J2P57_02420 [Acidimicrobiaceae bacterium]|nr:hypothetical protein [Acidimicrobiaceae bacterium]
MSSPLDQIAGDLQAVAGQLGGILAEVERLGDPAALAGDPATLKRVASAWRGMASELRQLEAPLRRQAQETVAWSWQEPASDAFLGSWRSAEAKVEDLAADFDRGAGALEDAVTLLLPLREWTLSLVMEAQTVLRALQGPPDPSLLATAQRASALVAQLREALQQITFALQALSSLLLALMLAFEHMMRSVPRVEPQTMPRPGNLVPGLMPTERGVAVTATATTMPSSQSGAGPIDPNTILKAAVLAALLYALMAALSQALMGRGPGFQLPKDWQRQQNPKNRKGQKAPSKDGTDNPASQRWQGNRARGNAQSLDRSVGKLQEEPEQKTPEGGPNWGKGLLFLGGVVGILYLLNQYARPLNSEEPNQSESGGTPRPTPSPSPPPTPTPTPTPSPPIPGQYVRPLPPPSPTLPPNVPRQGPRP